jgi:integrase
MGAFVHFSGFFGQNCHFFGFGLFNGTLWRWQNHRPVFQMQPAFWRKIGTVARHFVAGIRAIPQLLSGMSLHSYRYAWAERALKCGFPERFAQQAFGHNSKAVHRAYAYSKHAEVTVPSLDDWEKEWEKNPQRNAQPKLLPVDSRCG